jgi:hypothetical protein
MTALAINYVVNPLHIFWKRIERVLLIIGYSRAAAELARMGYPEIAKDLILQKGRL